ncbi:hypothetical protein [Spiroplasma taiwanense]|uniref:Uncharacterized protein n=1 Tax=Spiroplasma taiwanense CT-1 TaxID=1276220 RepID=S5MAZ7_9MOLU|nr:hypothetical protein [Spiroplasma taiwanense]AGR40943.1 hypothetical protein STAIW_v1c02790 [Spiroplasma taiwanense CT-1]
MSEKTTLKDIVEINKVLTIKKYDSYKEFLVYTDIIQEYIDDTFFRNDVIIERLVEYAQKSARYLDITFKEKSDIKLTVENIHDYMLHTKRAVEKALFIEDEAFNFSIFVEIRSIVRYFLEKTYEFESLRNYEILYGINTMEFHQQNESFKYLYTVFDKFTYISKHLNEKYVKKNEKLSYQDVQLKFFTHFLKDISFLSKSTSDFQKLSDIIELITYSKAWHYIRRLRNSIEHDFVDPTYKYNISLSLELLFIIIGRIMLGLTKYLKSENEIRETLDSLKSEKLE